MYERMVQSLIESQPSHRLAYGGDSRPGTTGRPNQDCMRIVDPEAPLSEEKGLLFIVADGLGGYGNGEVASRMVCEELPRLYYECPGEDCRANLLHAVMQMNAILYKASSAKGELHGMCTTLVAAVVRGDTLYVVHVGDSKAYLFRRGRVAYASTDHCIQIPTFESDGKRFLTQSLGARRSIAPSDDEIRLTHGDIIVLCTDGLSDSLLLEDIIAGSMADEPPAAVADLVQAANEAGGTDDISVILAKVTMRC
ncbi:MAG: protein phosphatase 2C domain-containing protein [Bacteroidota bacterium]